MTNQEFIETRKQILKSKFSNLNDMQQEAVFSTEGPLLVLAGAGSGKTTVLVNRIVNLIKFGKAYYSDECPYDITKEDESALFISSKTGELTPELEELIRVKAVNPWQILAITFTNKAASELKSRLEDAVGPEAQDIWASTFHSACVKILRRNASTLGYTSNFTIYDVDDSKRVIKECLKEIGIDEKFLPVKSVISEISKAKDSFIFPDEYIKEYENDFQRGNIGKIYKLYQEKLLLSDAMDFDDLILNTVILFKNNPEILDFYQNKFRYILIDEYQDTNHLQYLFVSLLASKYRNLCVVGDDDQSIYRFRGADIENILSFEKDYNNAKIIKLEKNYRSTQNILDAGNSVIRNNFHTHEKKLWTDKGAGEKIIRHISESDRNEGYYVANNIIKEKGFNRKFSDFAVLYRMNSQSNMIEQAFVQSGIPYRIIGGHKFYDRKEIKDALAYLSVIANHNDSVRMGRIINEPKRGIGEASFAAVEEISSALGLSLIEVLKNASDYPKLSRSASKLIAFAEMIEEFTEFAENHTLAELLPEVINKSGYLFALDKEPEKKEDRIENLDQLVNNIRTYEEENDSPTLNDFLQEIALMTDIDNYNTESDAVVLMTVHSAKGLEFDTVFLVGMEEGIFPSDLSKDDEAGIQEERRLAYVAITRAKNKLYITNCKSRMLFGMTRFNPESRFIREIPENLTEPSEENKKQAAQVQSSKSSFGQYEKKSVKRDAGYGFSGFTPPKPKSNVIYKVGDTVIHKTFGEGVIVAITPMSNDSLLEIAFLEGKTKKIMANYAKLEKK